MEPVKIYQVGGSLRDQILGLKSKDIDYAVECASFDAMRQYIIDSGGTIYLETPQYYTIRAKIPELGDADYVLCRKDGVYKDGRRPESVEAGTIYDDLARRDFCMNAIAKNVLTGEIIDPYNGQNDIKRKIIRCVRKAEDRFNEDALRILRAVRFSITKGMSIDSEIHNCLEDHDIINLLDKISMDRKRDELYKCFAYSTNVTLVILEHYPYLRHKLFVDKEIWLEPTNKKV